MKMNDEVLDSSSEVHAPVPRLCAFKLYGTGHSPVTRVLRDDDAFLQSTPIKPRTLNEYHVRLTVLLVVVNGRRM